MLAIELAKFPPPTPPRAATRSSTGNGVSGLETTMPSSVAGMSRSPAETIVQLRPPKIATMKVYGNRSVAPTRLGTEMSQNSSELDRVNPAAGSMTTTMLHSCQMMKPRNSAKIDHWRLRRAIGRPSDSQNPESSGFQPSTHRPGRRVRVTPDVTETDAAASVVEGVTVLVMWRLQVSDPDATLCGACFGARPRGVNPESPCSHRRSRVR